MNTMDNDEIEIDLRELFGLLLNRLWLILLVGILTAAAAGVGSKLLLTPIYTSETQLFILNKSASLTSLSLSDLQMGSQLTKDYMVLVKSRPVLQQVIANLELKEMEYEDLLEIITITNPADTRILKIAADYPDPVMAKRIVDEIADVSRERIATIMDMEQPNIAEEGYVAKNQTSPNILKNTAIGGLIGAVLTIFIICILFILDDTIKSSEDIEKYLGINTIGLIPVEDSELQSPGKKKKAKKKKR